MFFENMKFCNIYQKNISSEIFAMSLSDINGYYNQSFSNTQQSVLINCYIIC